MKCIFFFFIYFKIMILIFLYLMIYYLKILSNIEKDYKEKNE